MRMDAHCHTNCSDGNISIEDRIAMIRRCGYAAATITDHDFVSEEQILRARSAAGDMPYIPGIELSLRYANQVVHLLGYFIDPCHQGLQEHLEQVQSHDRALTEKLLSIFHSQGSRLDMEALEAPSLHTFYSMQLVKAVASELFELDPARTMAAFFQAYDQLQLSYPDFAPWDVRPAIDLIHSAGGIAVLAHPGGLEDRVMRRLDFRLHSRADIQEYCDWGLDGIETRTTVHTATEIQTYEQIASQLDLLATAGSDCHGDDPYLGAALMGTISDLPADLYERLVDCHDRRIGIDG